jgi:hypothetical protein
MITKKKINTHEYNIQEFWDIIKKPNLRIHGVEEGAEIQTKGIENLFNEIIAENFPNLCNNIGTQVQEALQTPNRHDQKRTTP